MTFNSVNEAEEFYMSNGYSYSEAIQKAMDAEIWAEEDEECY